ncbi:MAG TPA: NADH-quinone oxidoreductase subunit N [Solirubrobacteraceae bacterium]|nr:NADH-quinone oxidoreductase subunit N [Solirubrobacteraceae bacterium]
MNLLAATSAHHIVGPYIDWRALSPIVVLTGGGLLVLIVGLLRPAVIRERFVPALTMLVFLVALAADIWVYHHHAHHGRGGFCLVAAAKCSSAPLALDRLSLELAMLFAIAGIAAVLMSWRTVAPRESGHGEYGALLIFSVLGMVVFVSSQNLVSLFLGIELLSIPLYILCASETRRESSLESGLKYLVVGSVGSATLVYGLALIYGATGSTDFATIGTALSTGKLAGGSLGNPMVYTGLGLTIVGFAFKASVAPFHQWTPDVYEGAPTPITAFMATATKVAALGAFLRFFDVAAIGAQNTWAPLLATLAAITIIVGNVGALGQSSVKRMLGYSGVAQAGYMLAGVVVGTHLGVQATVLYLMFYVAMNLAPFAVIVAQEHERPDGNYLSAYAGLGARRPWLAWPMTIGMLGLAGIPGTVGFIGKFQLISALVSGAYTWLAIVLVIGSMISLGYYLRVIATIWMRPPIPVPAPAPAAPAGGAAAGAGGLAPIAGGSIEADDEWEEGPGPAGASLAYPELVVVAVGFAAATIFFGIFPSPLFHLAAHAANALSGLF